MVLYNCSYLLGLFFIIVQLMYVWFTELYKVRWMIKMSTADLV